MYEKKNTILVVDDEPQIQKMLGILLDIEHFKIVESLSGKQAIRMCASIKPDLVLLDLGLPDMDGKEVITSIREWSQVPIIVLSACALDEEITSALNLGANDYVTKPFNIDVLLARINASLRSCAIRETGDAELQNGTLRMDLVRFFMVNRGKMLTHKEILKSVWGAAHSDDTTYLRVYIGQIREKIESDTASPLFITTEPGIGYRMETFPHAVAKAA